MPSRLSPQWLCGNFGDNHFVITGRAHCFHDNIYITLVLLLWDLSTLYIHITYIIYIYIYTYIYIYIEREMERGKLLVKTIELRTCFARILLLGSMPCTMVIVIFLFIIILFDFVFWIKRQKLDFLSFVFIPVCWECVVGERCTVEEQN